MIENLSRNFIERVKKIKELNGERLEPEHLRSIHKKDDKIENNIWMKPEKLERAKIIYNDEKLNIYKKREIALLKKQIKEINSFYRQKTFKNSKFYLRRTREA